MASLEHIKGKYIEFRCFPTTFFPSPKFGKVRLRDENISKSLRVEELPSRILQKYFKVGIFAKNRQSPNFSKIFQSPFVEVNISKFETRRNMSKFRFPCSEKNIFKVHVAVFCNKIFQSSCCRVPKRNISKSR